MLSIQPIDSIPVLSVRRPYADQIVTRMPGHPWFPTKWCENRTWQPVKKPRQMFIHASGPGGGIIGYVTVLAIICTLSEKNSRETCIQTENRLRREVKKVYKDHNLQLPKRMDWSHGDFPWRYDADSEFPEAYWWVLGYPKKFRQQVDCKGHLNLWHSSSDILPQIREQMKTCY